MLGRSILSLSVCALICACKGNYKDKAALAADGGRASADAATAYDAGEAQAKSRASTRTQAARVAKDAGAESQPDAGDAAAAEKQNAAGASAANSGMESSKSGQGGAASAPKKPAKKETADAGQGGASADAGERNVDGDAQATCEQGCGPCQACGDEKTCQPVTGRDDADSCSEARSCSSRGECLHSSEAQLDLGSMQDYAELTQSYAQVVTFSEPATAAEIRLEVSCNENDQTFPAVWIAAAPGGIPSDTIIATANVLYQPPTDTNTFALLELSKTLEQPATGPIAIVVSNTTMSCVVRLNKENPYPNGTLFTQSTPLWTPTEGSMVFQVLSSQ